MVDTNHNAKYSWYQMIGGYWETVMGKYFLDPWILKLAGVSQELWRIQDYASDLLVLRLASAETIYKVNLVEDLGVGSKAFLDSTLYFTRLRLFAVNSKVLGFKERIMYTWEKIIWLTSFLKPSVKDIFYLTSAT